MKRRYLRLQDGLVMKMNSKIGSLTSYPVTMQEPTIKPDYQKELGGKTETFKSMTLKQIPPSSSTTLKNLLKPSNIFTDQVSTSICKESRMYSVQLTIEWTRECPGRREIIGTTNSHPLKSFQRNLSKFSLLKLQNKDTVLSTLLMLAL